MSTEFDVAGLTFSDEGISVQYMRVPQDIRVEGAMFAQHTLSVAAARYPEECEEMRDQVVRFLVDLLEDFDESLPFTPDLPEDEDDERGMGE